MYNFDIYTDSSCDLEKEMVEKYDLKVMQLEVTINDGEPILNCDIEAKDLYDKLRDGAMAKTNAVTPGYFEAHMRKSLEEGKDILYIGFTSGLSVTYNNAAMIISELQDEFPERSIKPIDTLCASVGQGLLVHYAAVKREEGIGLEEVFQQLMTMKDKIHHQVTVDDLFFLKRGGRVSATAAVAGSILSLKPMIDVNSEGKLDTLGTVRGRKAAMRELVAKMKETADIEAWNQVFISHGDCLADAERVRDMVLEAFPNAQVNISYVGAVIGAHTGPGVIALCYLGNCIKGSKA